MPTLRDSNLAVIKTIETSKGQTFILNEDLSVEYIIIDD